MTALHERLQALHQDLGAHSTGLTGHTVLISGRQAAEIHAALGEAATALQSSVGGEVVAQVSIGVDSIDVTPMLKGAAREALRARLGVGIHNLYLASPAQPSDGWRTMDSAPRDGTAVLLFCGDRDVVSGHHYANDCWTPEHDICASVYPTYWQPLTATPSAPLDAAGGGA